MGKKNDFDVIARKKRVAECVKIFVKEKGSTPKMIAERMDISESTVKAYLTNKELIHEIYGSIDGNKIYDYCQKKFEVLKKLKKNAISQDTESKRKGR